MKLLLKIKNIHINDGLRMLEVDGLTVTKKELNRKDTHSFTYEAGYEIIIKKI